VGDEPPTGSGTAEQAIVEALRTVYDPCCREHGISVVDMGLIDSLQVDADEARIELVLTSGWCPFAVQLLSEVRERVESLPQIAGATVEIRWDRGWSSDRMSLPARTKLRLLPDPAQVPDREAFVRAHVTRTGEGGNGR
jgi:metal-sulfur cluster biosynthetic enzyme